MDIEELNTYLKCLTGPVTVDGITLDKSDITASLTIKFEGDVGTLDKGEIELTFHGIEIIALPIGFIGPVQLSVSKENIDSNYSEQDCIQYILKDDVDIEWMVYASSYDVNFLPVYYGEE